MKTDFFEKKEFYKLQNSLCYFFSNINLLTKALSHPSNKSKNSFQYQRLEFLGDKILSMIITDQLFKKFPRYSEEFLTKHHNFLVKEITLFKIAKEIGLDKAIIINKGEEKCGGRNRSSNLADALESLLGAIYLDSNLLSVEKVVKKFWGCYISDSDVFIGENPKSELQEFIQSVSNIFPKYKLINCKGEDHNPIFTIKVEFEGKFGVGIGKSKKLAEEEAARCLLKQLN